MNVIGLQAFFYNHATALVENGQLRFFVEEEKISRVKGQREGFPIQSLKVALQTSGLKLDDIDEIAYPISPWKYAGTLVKGGFSSLLGGMIPRKKPAGIQEEEVSLLADRILVTLPFTPLFLNSLIRHRIRFGGVSGRIPPIKHVGHHLAHAASTFYTSGMDRAAIVVVDGLGETESTTIWLGEGTKLERLATIKFPNSLGEFYAAFTEFCGFRTYEQEGKLMGLAAYGGPDEKLEEQFKKVIQITPEHYHVSPKYTIHGNHSFGTSFSDALVEEFGKPRAKNEELTDRHRNIAYAAQFMLEKATLEIVRKAVRLTNCGNVCLSGGVAMNCKLNGVVLHSDMVDQLFVLPAANDAGVALGAAMVRSVANGDDPRFELTNTYYGPEFSDDEIEAVLQNVKVPYRKIDTQGVDQVADMLMDKKVVGIYAGRNEFGARALGARSILADPRFREMWDVVNESVKHRERWRPFAPVILAGHENDYLENGQTSRYMMKAFTVRESMRDKIPAVVHVDQSCRPQSIDRETNPMYFDILNAFYKKTGVPILMNTSFNDRDEPIVSKPVEAIRCYLSTGMDALVIGSFLLRKDGNFAS